MNESTIIAFFNGEACPLDELKVPANDRGYLFADAVYEVLRVYDGQAFLIAEHIARLANSLRALCIEVNVDIAVEIQRCIAVNNVFEGMVYLQISRGAAPRNHSFDKLSLTPNILMYAKRFLEHPSKRDQINGIKAITHEDLRWSRCDIKTTNLLANCMIQTGAFQHGASEAILLRNDLVTEGTSSNIFLVKDGTYCTPPLSQFILPGTRRKLVLDRLRATGRKVIERQIEKTEIAYADEIFITSTVKEIVPIIEVDQKPVGKGVIGNHAQFALGLIKDAVACAR